jgi:hypothetical protein
MKRIHEVRNDTNFRIYESRNEKGGFNKCSREESKSKQEDVSIRHTTKRERKDKQDQDIRMKKKGRVNDEYQTHQEKDGFIVGHIISRYWKN